MFSNSPLVLICSILLAVNASQLHSNEESKPVIVERKVFHMVKSLPARTTPGYCTINVQAYSGYDSPCNGANEGFVKLNGNTVWTAGWCSTSSNLRGVTIFIVDPSSCTATSIQRFDTHAYESNAVALATHLLSVPPGAVVVGVTGDEPTSMLGPALETMKSVGVDVSDVQYGGNFAFILQKDYNFQPIIGKRSRLEAAPGKLNVRLEAQATILVQQHFPGTTFFNRTWAEYKVSFGDASSNYWIGNDKLHQLTVNGTYKLRVEMLAKSDSQWYWAEYTTFRVTDERAGYSLWVDGYTGTAGDAMYQNNGMRFSTKDSDRDTHCSLACAADPSYGNNGGFWYSDCGLVFINSPVDGTNDFSWWNTLVPGYKLMISRMSLLLI